MKQFLDDEDGSFPELTAEDYWSDGRRLSSTYVYMNESLTPMNKELLRDAKKLAKDRGYTHTGYTYKGKVRVRKSDTSKVIQVRHKSDLSLVI